MTPHTALLQPATGKTAAAVSLALITAILTGCAAPRTPAPDSTLTVPTAWAARTAGEPVAAAWWRGFGDEVLDGLVSTALQNNSNLRAARSRVQEYRARAAVVDAGSVPSLDMSAGPTRARARNGSGVLAQSTTYQLGVQASYEVDLWGRLDRLTDSALASVQAQRAARDAAELSIAAMVAAGYFNLRGLDAQLALARETVTSRKESLSRAQRLFDAGYSSRLDWAQAESEYQFAAAAVPPLERSVSQQENALSILMGRNPGPVERGRAIADIVAPAIAAGLPSELLRRRPDIAQAELQLVSLNYNLQASRDQLLPSLRLSAGASIQGLTLHQLVDGPTTIWSIGASVLEPLLQRARLQAGVDMAAAQRDQALLSYEDVVRHAFAEVEDALKAIASISSQQQALSRRSQAAAQALRIAQSRYRNGYASYLEELDAQRTSYAAQQGLLQSNTAQLTASVDLYRALGGGWNTAAE